MLAKVSGLRPSFPNSSGLGDCRGIDTERRDRWGLLTVCIAGLDLHLKLLTLEFNLRVSSSYKYILTIAIPLTQNLCSNSTLSSGNSLKASGDTVVRFLFLDIVSRTMTCMEIKINVSSVLCLKT